MTRQRAPSQITEPFSLGEPRSLGLRGSYFNGANRSWDEGRDGRLLIARMGARDVPQGSPEVQVVVGFSRVLEQRKQ